MRTLITLEPATLVAAPEPSLRALRVLQRSCFQLVNWRGFDTAIGLTIAANIAIMCMRQAGQTSAYTSTMAVANIVFTVIFALEALLKVLYYSLVPDGFFLLGRPSLFLLYSIS